MHALPAAPIRARLHRDDLQTLMTQLHDARDPQDLLNIVVAGVYLPLLAAQGRSLLALTRHDRIDSRAWQLPAPQLDAIIAAACNRAAAWGAAANIGVALMDKLPKSFPDDEPAQASRHTDYWPAQMLLRMDRGAAQVFLAAHAHLQSLATCYGPGHQFHLQAQSSWVAAVTLLMGVALGPDTTMSAADELSLQVKTSGGGGYHIGFEPLPRICLAGDGCQAIFADDGLVTNPSQYIAGHVHHPVYPCTAVKPGVWHTRTTVTPVMPA